MRLANSNGVLIFASPNGTPVYTNRDYIPIFAPTAPIVRSLPKCRRCGNRTVAREFMDCNVCKGRGRR